MTANGHRLLTLVANQSMHVPSSKLIRLITVPEGPNIADDKIMGMLAAGDVVITGDIPLAARVVEKAAIAAAKYFEGYMFSPGLPMRHAWVEICDRKEWISS